MVDVNMTNHFENVTTLKEMFNVPNLVTSNFAWIGLLMMMQVIIFISFLPWGAVAAGLSSAFIVLIVGLFLTYLEWVAWEHLMIFLGQILFLIIYITWQDRKS